MFGQLDKAREYGLKGYKLGWADGWPYVNWWILDRAKRVLAALGETDETKIQAELGLMPFDESKVEKIPYEDEIRAVIADLEAKKRQK